MLRGNAAIEILQAATDVGADLIVMGTHGRNWLTHALVGSVTEEVLRKAECPVLSVKQPHHASSGIAAESIPASAYPPVP
jgi:nucleotide-binding universal stress UspA family protein